MKKEDCPHKVEQLLRAYLANRQDEGELFFSFANRLDTDQLTALMEQHAA